MLDDRTAARRRPRLAAALAGLTLAVATFAQQPVTPTEARAERLQQAARKFDRVDGTLALGSEQVAYRAYLKDGAIAYLEERVTGSDQRTRDQRYFFAAGRLFFYAADAARGKVTGSGPSALGAFVPVRVEWNDRGQVIRGVRLEHYGEVKLDPQTLAAITSRAGLLSRLAMLKLKAAPAPAGTPP